LGAGGETAREGGADCLAVGGRDLEAVGRLRHHVGNLDKKNCG
jgi:hypothetical protein